MNAPTTKAETLAYYTAMAAKAMRDNRKPAPRAPLLLSGFEHRGCTFDIYGTFDAEEGAQISEVRATGDLFDILDGATIHKMATACDRAALKERDESLVDVAVADREFV